MSSFRPQARSTARTFVAEKRSFAPGFASRASVATKDRASVEEPEPVGRLVSDEEIAALESAAFDRGVRSQQVEMERFHHACDALAASAAAWESSATTIRLGSPEEIVELALEIARSWVGERFEADPERFLAALGEALELCRDHEPQRLFLHAEDLDAIESLEAGLLEEWKRDLCLEIAVDAELGRGEFRIDALRGLLDGRFEAVSSRLRDALAAGGPNRSVTSVEEEDAS